MEPTLRRSERLKMKRDMISALPNAILLHILTFMLIKDIVKTSVLSKRWKNLWKHLPDLQLNTFEFSNPWVFGECLTGIVSSRSRGNYPLHSLDFNHPNGFQHMIFTNLITHAISQGLKKLKVVVPSNLGLPDCVFISHSLTSLHISGSSYDFKIRHRLPKNLDLPSLTSLHLDCVKIETDHEGHYEPFSSCNKLNNLFIKDCYFFYPTYLSSMVKGIFYVTNATLTNLTIEDTSDPPDKYLISTPKLCSFIVNGSPFQASAFPWVKIESSSLM